MGAVSTLLGKLMRSSPDLCAATVAGGGVPLFLATTFASMEIASQPHCWPPSPFMPVTTSSPRSLH